MTTSSGLLIWTLIFGLGLTPGCLFGARLLKQTAARYTNMGATDTYTYRAWSKVFKCAAFVTLVASVLCLFATLDQVQSDGVQAETDLNAQYVENQNILSTYVTSFSEQLGVANLESAKIKGIITEAVAGQADPANLVAPGQSPLFLAVAQAYPEVSADQYQQLIDYIQKGREAFQTGQANLLAELSAFDTWRHAGFIFHPWLVEKMGFPTSLLTVTVNGQTLHGAAAEDEMWKIVKNPTADTAFNTGIEKPLPLPGN